MQSPHQPSGTVCCSLGGAYALTGCQANCVTPISYTGYNIASKAENNLACNGNISRVSGVTCATGYSGSAEAEVCTVTAGYYTLTGCKLDCAAPATAGYVFTGASGSKAYFGFAVSGITCGDSYSGTPVAQVCTTAGQAYRVSGCSLTAACTSLTTAPTGYVVTGKANTPWTRRHSPLQDYHATPVQTLWNSSSCCMHQWGQRLHAGIPAQRSHHIRGMMSQRSRR